MSRAGYMDKLPHWLSELFRERRRHHFPSDRHEKIVFGNTHEDEPVLHCARPNYRPAITGTVT